MELFELTSGNRIAHLGIRILAEASIQDRVGDNVAKLVCEERFLVSARILCILIPLISM